MYQQANKKSETSQLISTVKNPENSEPIDNCNVLARTTNSRTQEVAKARDEVDTSTKNECLELVEFTNNTILQEPRVASQSSQGVNAYPIFKPEDRNLQISIALNVTNNNTPNTSPEGACALPEPDRVLKLCKPGMF